MTLLHPLFALAATTLHPPTTLVAAGAFVMGGGHQDPVRALEAHPHDVVISRPFVLSTTEVTQAQYREVTGRGPARADFAGVSLLGDDLPIHSITWFETVAYCNALSARQGLAPAYAVEGEQVTWDPSARGWRLPTEAEWEYAARGGVAGPMPWADSEAKACAAGNLRDASMTAVTARTGGLGCDDGHVGLAPVGSYPPNPFGLHDMLGNTWEWVWDWHSPYGRGPDVDPGGPSHGTMRSFRGGAWWSWPGGSMFEYRHRREPAYKDADIGFRIAMSVPTP